MKHYTYLIFCLSLLMAIPVNAAKLSDRKATPETKALYRQLFGYVKNKQILFGQQDATAYGIGWKGDADKSDMKTVSGSHPAVYGWDLGGIEKGDENNLDGVNFNEMRKLILEAYQRGGIITISWHLINPVSGLTAWDNKTPSSIDSILNVKKYNDKYNLFLDRLSAFFKSLIYEGKPLPVIFRPFHEHNADWFWWGAGQNSVESYKQLWRYTENYLKKTKDVHNLIYAYSPDKIPDHEKYFERYPGDEYVDVLGFDCYHFGGESTATEFVAKTREMLKYITDSAKKRHKLAAFTETGLETVNQNDWWTGVLYKIIYDMPIAYVLVWRNAYDRPNHFYGPTPNHPTNKDFIKFINNQNIITGNKLKSR